MTHKTINVRCIRGMFNCSEAEARTFLCYLERCEMVEKLDIEDFYYVIKDAVEGFVVLLKVQKQLFDVKAELEKNSKGQVNCTAINKEKACEGISSSQAFLWSTKFMAGNLLCSQDAATAAFPTQNKTSRS